MKGPVVVTRGVQVEIIDVGAVFFGIAVADKGHHRGVHVVVGVADQIIQRQGSADQLVHRRGDQLSVDHRHAVVDPVSAFLPQLFHSLKERVQRGPPQLVQTAAAGFLHKLQPVGPGVLRPARQGEFGEHPAAGHHDGPAKEPGVFPVQAQILDGDGAGALAQQRDVVSVAAEIADMGLDPADGAELIVQPEIAFPAVFLPDLLMAQIAQGAHPVIGEYRNDPPGSQAGSVEGLLPVDAGVEAAAVEKEHDRAALRLLRRIDIQVQTVLAVTEAAAFPVFPLVKAAGRMLQVLVPAPVLRTGIARCGGVQHALPALPELRVGEALRPGVGDSQKLQAALPFVSHEPAAGAVFPDCADHVRSLHVLTLFFLIIADCRADCHSYSRNSPEEDRGKSRVYLVFSLHPWYNIMKKSVRRKTMDHFKLVSSYQPTGDQPEAIDELVRGLENGLDEQVLLGVTGSGKTFTMANVIARLNRPTLVLAHNKTLAAQLCSEFKEFFPENAVEYFVSYYDYYQPEAYIPHTVTYIEKDASINDEIERLRHSATSSLFERRDVIVVASVSCIYGLGDPIDYANMVVSLRPGQNRNFDELLRKLIEIRYERNDVAFERNKFRVRGDTLEVFPAYSNDRAIRVEFFGDEIDRISEINVVTGAPTRVLNHVAIYPASHYVTTKEKMAAAIERIRAECDERVAWFEANNKLLEAQRIRQRTEYDIEMMQELGYCSGIENYSRVISNRAPGSPPMTLLDYFPKDFLLFVDESHVTLPQVRAMYRGDRARKESLVEFGFRLPSAYDNRPLKFEEFTQRIHQRIYVSATPGDYERERAGQVVEQIIRPTGLLDPEIFVRPVEGQIDDLMQAVQEKIQRNQRVLVTTLTKKMAEDLSAFLLNAGIRCRYMHHDIGTIERMEIIRDLRLGEFDVLVGINLLREGLDIPEVGLVAILDADKEGFLRSETSLIQTVGRAARNAESYVIMYADTVTPSMRACIDETNRRRAKQMAYNRAMGIVPKTIIKSVRDLIEISAAPDGGVKARGVKMTERERRELIADLESKMRKAAQMLEYEIAAQLRDEIIRLRGEK